MASETRTWVVDGDKPALLDYSPAGYFDESRMDPALRSVAGPEVLVISRSKESGRLEDDLVVLPPGLASMVPDVTRFYAAIGLPVSRRVVYGYEAAEVPPTIRRKHLRSHHPGYDDGSQRYADWGRFLGQTLTKSQFIQWCKDHGFGDRVPQTDKYEPGQEPSLADIKAYFDRAPVWWVKSDQEVLFKHPVFRADSPEEMARAVLALKGYGYIVQQHVQGISTSVDYDLGDATEFHPVFSFSHAGEELVRKGFQYGLNAFKKHLRLRAFTDDVAMAMYAGGLDGMLGLGVIWDENANDGDGAGWITDNNERMGGGHPVRLLKAKAEVLAGAPLGLDTHYQYLAGTRLDGPRLLSALLRSDTFRPNPATLEGVWPVGWRPDGGGKFAVFGPDGRELLEEAKTAFGLYIPVA